MSGTVTPEMIADAEAAVQAAKTHLAGLKVGARFDALVPGEVARFHETGDKYVTVKPNEDGTYSVRARVPSAPYAQRYTIPSMTRDETLAVIGNGGHAAPEAGFVTSDSVDGHEDAQDDLDLDNED